MNIVLAVHYEVQQFLIMTYSTKAAQRTQHLNVFIRVFHFPAISCYYGTSVRAKACACLLMSKYHYGEWHLL